MLKFLLISFLIGYIFYKGLGLIIRYLLGAPSAQQYGQQRNTQRPGTGNVNVAYDPNKEKKKGKGFGGGEYVDFEEVE